MDKKYIKNHDGTDSNFLYSDYKGITDLTTIIPLLKEMDYPFFPQFWYSDLDHYPEHAPFAYLGRMRMCSFKAYSFKDSIIYGTNVNIYGNSYKYIERLKTELKNHKEILDLVYKEEKIDNE